MKKCEFHLSKTINYREPLRVERLWRNEKKKTLFQMAHKERFVLSSFAEVR